MKLAFNKETIVRTIDEIIPFLLTLFAVCVVFENNMVVGNVTYVSVFGFLISLLVITNTILKKERFHFKMWLLPLFVACFLYCVSFFYTVSREWWWYFLKIMFKNFLFLVFVSSYKFSKKQQLLFISSVFFAGIVGATIMVISSGFSLNMANRLTIDVNNTYTDPNFVGAFFFLSCCSGLYLSYLSYVTGKKKNFYFLVPALLYVLFCFLLTGSRTGLICSAFSFLIFVCYMFFYKKKRLDALLIFLFVFLAVFMVYLFLPAGIKSRFTIASLIGSGVSDPRERLSIWRGVFTLAGEKPLFGFGGGSFIEIDNRANGVSLEAHNVFIATYFELGALGLLFILTFYVFVIIEAFKSKSLLALIIAFSVLIYSCFFDSFYYKFFFWFLVFLSVIQSDKDMKPVFSLRHSYFTF